MKRMGIIYNSATKYISPFVFMITSSQVAFTPLSLSDG